MFQGLAAEAYDRTYSDAQLLRRVGAYLAVHLKRVRTVLLLSGVTTAIGFVQPVITARGLDAVRQRAGDPASATQLVVIIATALFAFAIVNWLCNMFRRWAVSSLMASVIATLRADALSAVLHHDLSFFDKYPSGKIVSRISNDTAELQQTSNLITDLVSQLIILIALVIYLFTVSVQMTLILLAMAPVVVLMGAGFRTAARWATRRGFRAVAEVNTSIQEAVSGMRIAKNFRQESAMYAAFKKVNNQSYSVNLRRALVTSNIFPTLNIVSGMGSALLMWVGAQFAGSGAIGVGAWYLFIISLDLFWFPLTNLASFWSQLQSGLSALERVFALIDTPRVVNQVLPAESETAGLLSAAPRIPVPDAHDRGAAITFSSVTFRYTSQQTVLHDFSLSIAPGESVAFVGHTGAGKSSLIKLIGRFYEYQQGAIAIDGVDLRTLDLQAYRARLGIISQQPFLFAGTVRDNVRYARPRMTDDEVESLARSIGHGDWIETLPAGLDSDVGERGARLSMGQRQLVALARVLAQKPAIFMLDEATASIDPFTERQIQRAIDQVLRHSTSILVAHRLSTVRAVDRIIVLDQGRIVEEGNHDALMKHGGKYANLFDTYFRHQTADFRVQA